MHYFYVLRCKDGTLYCGSTKNTKNREKLHNAGKGSVYVKTHGGGKVVYTEGFKTLSNALRREIQVKKWSRIQKKNLIKGLKS
ncbi:MAG: GIY-YIG nuclease family protein [Candidatus Doudnabacteria bacterium]|nr:GIY-YIG nuclease family protein [Candidatus Doudnabacteria bacterium]